MSDSPVARRILEAARKAGEEALDAERARQAGELGRGAARIDAELAARRSAAEKRLREAHQQALSSFRLGEANRVRTERRRALDRVVDHALRKAREPARYRAWLVRELAANCRPGDEIVVTPAERTLFERDLSGDLARLQVKVSAEAGAFQGGFVAVRPGSGTRLNCTLDKAFAEAVRAAEVEAARALLVDR